MKKFIIKTNIFFTMLLLQEFAYARQAVPSNNLVAYRNEITDISYEQTDAIALVIQSQVNPICIYAPLTYQEYEHDNIQKTYFFPRTKLTDTNHLAFVEKLELLGIDVKIDEIRGKNYGLQMVFMMQSDHPYQIVKTIDRDEKSVRFDFVKKI